MAPDARLTSLPEKVRELEVKLSDAEWDLDFDTADRIYEELCYYRKLVDQGELWIPNF